MLLTANPSTACPGTSPVPPCCLFLAVEVQTGLAEPPPAPSVLPGHDNPDLGAAKVQSLLLSATKTCSTSAFPAALPGQQPSRAPGAGNDQELTKSFTFGTVCEKALRCAVPRGRTAFLEGSLAWRGNCPCAPCCHLKDTREFRQAMLGWRENAVQEQGGTQDRARE